jgi:hypothetical protein
MEEQGQTTRGIVNGELRTVNYELLRSILEPAGTYGVWGEFELAGLLARTAVYGNMSP